LSLHLSPVELKVVALTAQGLTREAIGRQLGITLNTVKSHLYRVSARWGCSSAAHVVGCAYEAGLLPIKGISAHDRRRPRGVTTRPITLNGPVVRNAGLRPQQSGQELKMDPDALDRLMRRMSRQ
jgi:DNA-binding CsgD family transcriptional regulator